MRIASPRCDDPLERSAVLEADTPARAPRQQLRFYVTEEHGEGGDF